MIYKLRHEIFLYLKATTSERNLCSIIFKPRHDGWLSLDLKRKSCKVSTGYGRIDRSMALSRFSGWWCMAVSWGTDPSG